MKKLSSLFIKEGEIDDYEPYVPNIKFTPSDGTLEIYGWSVGLNLADGLVSSIYEWLEEYCKAPYHTTTLIFEVDYEYDYAGDEKFFLGIMSKLREVPNFKVIWRYEKDNYEYVGTKQIVEKCKELNILIEVQEV